MYCAVLAVCWQRAGSVLAAHCQHTVSTSLKGGAPISTPFLRTLPHLNYSAVAVAHTMAFDHGDRSALFPQKKDNCAACKQHQRLDTDVLNCLATYSCSQTSSSPGK